MQCSKRHKRRLIKNEKERFVARLFERNAQQSDNDALSCSMQYTEVKEEQETTINNTPNNTNFNNNNETFINESDGKVKQMNTLIDAGVTNYFMEKTPCKNCIHLAEMMEAQKETMKQLVAEHKSQKQTINDLQENLEHQNKHIVEMLAEQRLELRALTNKQTEVSALTNKFPLRNEDEVKEMENNIDDLNQEKHIAAVKHLLGGDAKKNLEKVLARELCLDYNVDGKCGKKSLKKHKKLFDVLIFSISSYSTKPETDLKTALQVVKKREFRLKSFNKYKSTSK